MVQCGADYSRRGTGHPPYSFHEFPYSFQEFIKTLAKQAKPGGARGGRDVNNGSLRNVIIILSTFLRGI